jgi:hypothetical protein
VAARGSAGQLRLETVDVHLVVLVVGERSDHAFDHFAHHCDRLALPDADPESVIARCRVDRERDPVRQSRLEGLGLGVLKSLWVVNPVDDRDEHGGASRSTMCVVTLRAWPRHSRVT